MNLLFCIDCGFTKLFMGCLRSIHLRGGAEQYSVYILHSDLGTEDMDYILENAPESMEIQFIEVPETMFSGFPETKRYPQQIYYRLAAPMLLPKDMERILYLDADITVINSLVPLYTSDFGGADIMACTHTGTIMTKINQARLKTEKDTPYINTGVMLFHLPAMRKNMDINDICAYALKNQKKLILPDQDILTALYGDRVKLLDSMIYNLSDRILAMHNANPVNEKRDLEWVRENSVIVHYFGSNKPWKEHYTGILDVFYHEYNELREIAEKEYVS